MRNIDNSITELDYIDDHSVYPGHPVTLAYLIMCNYRDYPQAAAVRKGEVYANALGDQRIPGAGVNVRCALNLLEKITVQGIDPNAVFEEGSQLWTNECKNGYMNAHFAGQSQADGLKENFLEKALVWG